MLKKIILLLIICTVVNQGFSQKIIEKNLDALGIEKLVINSNEIFNISVSTERSDAIQISAKIVGENYENAMITSRQEGKILWIGTSYTPFFEAKNDKLAAHKVLSIEMTLMVPESMELTINSSSASVETSGAFEFLRVSLDNGNCTIKDFFGNATLGTKAGEISVYARAGVTAEAITENGVILNTLPLEGIYYITARTKTGNISLFQTK